MNTSDSLKGMIGLSILTPIATTAIGGLSALGGGLGQATQSIASAGFIGAAGKMTGFLK
jgi:hypothetical protein